jgi:hypothetical protein
MLFRPFILAFALLAALCFSGCASLPGSLGGAPGTYDITSVSVSGDKRFPRQVRSSLQRSLTSSLKATNRKDESQTVDVSVALSDFKNTRTSGGYLASTTVKVSVLDAETHVRVYANSFDQVSYSSRKSKARAALSQAIAARLRHDFSLVSWTPRKSHGRKSHSGNRAEAYNNQRNVADTRQEDDEAVAPVSAQKQETNAAPVVFMPVVMPVVTGVRGPRKVSPTDIARLTQAQYKAPSLNSVFGGELQLRQ